jgi:hypothetical protein
MQHNFLDARDRPVNRDPVAQQQADFLNRLYNASMADRSLEDGMALYTQASSLLDALMTTLTREVSPAPDARAQVVFQDIRHLAASGQLEAKLRAVVESTDNPRTRTAYEKALPLILEAVSPTEPSQPELK